LPYCKTGKELAEEYRFAVPAPPVPPREVDSETAMARPKSFFSHCGMLFSRWIETAGGRCSGFGFPADSGTPADWDSQFNFRA
jgi:hypothetical protein